MSSGAGAGAGAGSGSSDDGMGSCALGGRVRTRSHKKRAASARRSKSRSCSAKPKGVVPKRSLRKVRDLSVSRKAGPAIKDGKVLAAGRIDKVLSGHPVKFANPNQAAQYAKDVYPDKPSRARKLLYKFVYEGRTDRTPGGLTKDDLLFNKKTCAIVSKARHDNAVKQMSKSNILPHRFGRSKSKGRSSSKSKGRSASKGRSRSASKGRSRSASKGRSRSASKGKKSRTNKA